MTPQRPHLVVGKTFLALALAAAAALPLSAQAPGTTFGIGVGPIRAYPDDFVGGGCDGSYVGINVGVRRSLSSVVAFEGSVAWTGSLATSCALASDALSLPAPVDGASYTRTSLPSRIRGETFWATRVGAVVAPWSTGPLTPLVRVTGGRLWSKELWTWTVGAGLRYGFGRQAVVVDLERWNLAYDVTRETWIYRTDTADEFQSREMVQRRPRPWFVRLGWELTVGK